MKNSFYHAMWTGKHEMLLLAPVLGVAVLGTCIVTTRMADAPPAPDQDQCRRATLISAMDRTIAALQDRLETEPPLVGLKERGRPAPPAPILPEEGSGTRTVADSSPAQGDIEVLLDLDEPPPAAPLVLTGIASRKGRSVALVNRQVVEIGGTIAGFTLVAVNRYSVTLRDANGGQLILALGQEVTP